MHPNPVFRDATTDQNLAFAREIGFGLLTISADRGPEIAHVPFVLAPDGAWADVHLARSNPIARAALPTPAVIAIQGPHHYISPDWYGPHSEVPDQVPTWNYVAVHLRGQLQPLPAEALRTQIISLSAEHENRLAPQKRPWTVDKMSDGALERMMRMIVPFRLEISEIAGTWKLNQNKTKEIRHRASGELLRQQGQTSAMTIAQMMTRDRS